MVFSKATKDSYYTIKNILDKYRSISSQLVNFHKSAFQCTQNVSELVYANFANILQMEESFSLGKYVDCPIIDTKVMNVYIG